MKCKLHLCLWLSKKNLGVEFNRLLLRHGSCLCEKENFYTRGVLTSCLVLLVCTHGTDVLSSLELEICLVQRSDVLVLSFLSSLEFLSSLTDSELFSTSASSSLTLVRIYVASLLSFSEDVQEKRM